MSSAANRKALLQQYKDSKNERVTKIMKKGPEATAVPALKARPQPAPAKSVKPTKSISKTVTSSSSYEEPLNVRSSTSRLPPKSPAEKLKQKLDQMEKENVRNPRIVSAPTLTQKPVAKQNTVQPIIQPPKVESVTVPAKPVGPTIQEQVNSLIAQAQQLFNLSGIRTARLLFQSKLNEANSIEISNQSLFWIAWSKFEEDGGCVEEAESILEEGLTNTKHLEHEILKAALSELSSRVQKSVFQSVDAILSKACDNDSDSDESVDDSQSAPNLVSAPTVKPVKSTIQQQEVIPKTTPLPVTTAPLPLPTYKQESTNNAPGSEFMKAKIQLWEQCLGQKPSATENRNNAVEIKEVSVSNLKAVFESHHASIVEPIQTDYSQEFIAERKEMISNQISSQFRSKNLAGGVALPGLALSSQNQNEEIDRADWELANYLGFSKDTENDDNDPLLDDLSSPLPIAAPAVESSTCEDDLPPMPSPPKTTTPAKHFKSPRREVCAVPSPAMEIVEQPMVSKVVEVPSSATKSNERACPGCGKILRSESGYRHHVKFSCKAMVAPSSPVVPAVEVNEDSTPMRRSKRLLQTGSSFLSPSPAKRLREA